MSKLQTRQQVGVEEVQHRLSDELGPSYRVAVGSNSSLKVGRPGVIPSQVKVRHTEGGTTFEVRTTGLIVSRLIQAVAINPRVRRALEQLYGKSAG